MSGYPAVQKAPRRHYFDLIGLVKALAAERPLTRRAGRSSRFLSQYSAFLFANCRRHNRPAVVLWPRVVDLTRAGAATDSPMNPKLLPSVQEVKDRFGTRPPGSNRYIGFTPGLLFSLNRPSRRSSRSSTRLSTSQSRWTCPCSFTSTTCIFGGHAPNCTKTHPMPSGQISPPQARATDP